MKPMRPTLSVALSLFAALLLIPGTSIAQSFLPGTSPDLTISATPADPGPGDTVTLSVQSSLLDLSGADITWTSGGKTILEGVGATSAQVTMGPLGTPTSVSASASVAGQSANAAVMLVPESVDLLFDASSYAPPFYKGRTLPSPASSLRVQAIPHIITASGTAAPDTLTYTWAEDGSVLGSLSGRGRSSALLPPPPLFGSSVVSVEARTSDGAYSASASVRIPAIDPGITLYQDNPLFGIEFYNAVADRAAVADIETTFAAVPYFIAATSPDDPDLSYAWRVNGLPLASATSSSSEITLNAAGVSGPTTLSLGLTSSFDHYLSAQHSWTVSLGQRGGAFAAPLHAAASSNDAFHATGQ